MEQWRDARSRFAALAAALLIAGHLCCEPAIAPRAASHTPGEATRSDARADVDWPIYGGSAANNRYSPLTQIDRGNVHKLQKAWSFDTHETGGLQCSPLMVGRVLYGYTPTQKVIALDAATGRLLWTFDSGVLGTQPARGLTYWHEGNEARLFAGVMNFLYALDPSTGKPIASFGEGGRVDLRKQLRGDFEKQSIVLTTPGVVYQDLILVGGRNPETHPAPPGDIRAFDVRTGALRWSFHTIPHPGEAGYETWPREAWQHSGAANNWSGMTVDAARGIVYAPTGSAVFDFYGADRIGEDLYANTLLALDAKTGKRIWHFQGVHHDLWDRDFPSPPTLATLTREGKQVEAVAQTTKQGYIYVFDRATGKPLFPIEERAYPASRVPGETASLTQPMPLAPKPFARQLLTEDMLTDRSPAAHAFALEKFRSFHSAGQFIPLGVDTQTIVFPGFDGGAEWGGSALDPMTAVLYVNANEMSWTGGLTETPSGGSAGERAYRNYCSVCHGTHREGSPPAFPALTGVETKLADKEILLTIRQGKGRMPGFSMLDEAQMQSLLSYLKSAPVARASNAADKKELEASKDSGEAATRAGEAATRTGEAMNPAGASSYMQHCAICHGEHREGIGDSFPALLGVGSRLSQAQAIELIDKGKGRMPGFAMAGMKPIPEAELGSLLKFLGIGAPLPDEAVAEEDKDAMRYQFTGYAKFLDQDGYPAIAPPWGTLSAVDLNTGEYLWKLPLGEYPELAAKGRKDTGSENYGGPIVTAGGVVFIGATVYDRKMRAFDSHTGKLLWQTTLPYAGMATPITYSIDGKQYLVIATGGGKDPKSPSGGVYVAFALP